MSLTTRSWHFTSSLHKVWHTHTFHSSLFFFQCSCQTIPTTCLSFLIKLKNRHISNNTFKKSPTSHTPTQPHISMTRPSISECRNQNSYHTRSQTEWIESRQTARNRICCHTHSWRATVSFARVINFIMAEKPAVADRAALNQSHAEKQPFVLQSSEAAILQAQITTSSTWLSSTQFLWSCTSAWGMGLYSSDVAWRPWSLVQRFHFQWYITGRYASSEMSADVRRSVASSRKYGAVLSRLFFVGSVSAADLTHEINHLCLLYVYLAIAEFVAVYTATVGFVMAGESITRRIRDAAMRTWQQCFGRTLHISRVSKLAK